MYLAGEEQRQRHQKSNKMSVPHFCRPFLGPERDIRNVSTQSYVFVKLARVRYFHQLRQLSLSIPLFPCQTCLRVSGFQNGIGSERQIKGVKLRKHLLLGHIYITQQNFVWLFIGGCPGGGTTSRNTTIVPSADSSNL